jgi:two-component system CheB/CheR fusion protein
VLERVVIPRLFAGKAADGAVRVWVPGCATGEECYSLAILLREHMMRVPNSPKVQVFGTDIDEAAISTARLGLYPATLLDGLSAARRERFFRPSAHGYVLTKEVRELCNFSPHSIVRDPPFSRLDLISCRNLLIYMDTDLQASIMPAFHYALVKGGILLLGSAETASRHDGLFEALDSAARIFVRRDVPSPMQRVRGAKPAPNRASAWPAPAPRPRDDMQPPGFAEASAAALPPGRAASSRLDGGASPGWLGAWRDALRRLTLPARERDLPRQLIRTREQLQAVTEEHEATVEELRSANEELHSVNEELQSTNEELETSKEELQSVNEELHTVNARLTEKVDELDRINSDLRNLFDSTQIATVFLDRHLIVRNFTPAVASIYNLIPSDHGRPLTDIVSRLDYDGLAEDVAHVLDTLQPLERRVSRRGSEAHYLMRILPYRAPDSTVSGTLVTFLDVSTIVAAEQHHRLLVDELNHRVKNMLTVVTSLAVQTRRRAVALEDFWEAFMGRLQALTASYSLLSGQNWTEVALRDVILEETKPFISGERNNIEIAGPEVLLAPRGALAVGLAIHEMVTNAVKHGALSVPDGSVRIGWRFGEESERQLLMLEWEEANGPPVVDTGKRGFGMTVIERGFAHELSGSATVTFAEQGVYAIFRAPLDALREGRR